MGTHTVKAGYAGEDTPKAVFPAAVGWIPKDRLVDGDVEMKEAKTDKRSKSRGKKAEKEKEEEEEAEEEKKKGEKPKTPGINDDPSKTRHYYVDDVSFRRDHVDLTSPFDDDGRATRYRAALRAIEDGTIDVASIVSHRYSGLDSVPQAFGGDQHEAGYVKGIVVS